LSLIVVGQQAHTFEPSHKYYLWLATELSPMSLRPTVLPALGVFAAAARHQNFAHAAQELHLTASAVSHHVRRLEATLGVPLFRRHARGVALTAQGRVLADAATAALADLDAVSTALRSEKSDTAQVRLTTLHSLTYCWLLPRLPAFTAAHPDIRVHIETTVALTRFEEGGPELALRHGPGHWPGLTAYHLMDDALFPVAAPHLPGIAGVHEAAQVAKLPLIADLGFHGWREWFRACGVRAVRLPKMHSFSDSTDALQAAALGLGVALARVHIADPYLRAGQLIRLAVPAVKPSFGYYIVHPAHRRPKAAASVFIDWLRREGAKDMRSRAVPAAPESKGGARRARRVRPRG
jgi:DNA-binding transcriptional LysR family regulator